MSWSYRSIQHNNFVALHEVYYGDDGNPIASTASPMTLVGDSHEELIATLEMALADLRSRPIFTPPKEWKFTLIDLNVVAPEHVEDPIAGEEA